MALTRPPRSAPFFTLAFPPPGLYKILMTSSKAKFIFITALAFVLVIAAATQLRGGIDDRIQLFGWGFVLIFGCIFFVRGLFAIRRIK
jgi:hypothetical protein